MASIKDILRREPIRLMDGRYSTGFVSVAELNSLVNEGTAEVYDNQGVDFVRLLKPKVVTLDLKTAKDILHMVKDCGYGGSSHSRIEAKHEKALRKAIAKATEEKGT